DLAYGLDELKSSPILRDVALGTRLECAQSVLLLGVHAEHQNRHADVLCPDALDEIQPTHARHSEINDGQVNGVERQNLQGLMTAASGDGVPLFFSVGKYALQALAHDLVIIDDQDSQRYW